MDDTVIHINGLYAVKKSNGHIDWTPIKDLATRFSDNEAKSLLIQSIITDRVGLENADDAETNTSEFFVDGQNLRTMQVGDEINISGITWILANVNNSVYSFVTKHILTYTPLRIDLLLNSNEKAWCTLAPHISLCRQIQYALLGNLVSCMIGEVHLPTKAQVEGGWEYFSDDSFRRCVDLNGNPGRYWTSSEYSSNFVWFVTDDGGLYNYDPSYPFGFRPAFSIDTMVKKEG